MAYDAELPLPTPPAGWELLRQLADHLDTVKPSRYNQNTWRDDKKFLGISCGTVACAMGHAALAGIGVEWIKTNTGWSMAGVDGTPLPKITGVFGLAKEVFNISAQEALQLFGTSEEYIGPQGAAARIRRFVDEKVQAFNNEALHAVRR